MNFELKPNLSILVFIQNPSEVNYYKIWGRIKGRN
ncbi:hypothetical protein KSS87_022907 [Heliosperma pusillum]|nr:hypothetical protein KSS87_006873 [Heliosperma pusillum]KAH9621109.1 hypothetical protein KSS87_022907 [Heliosperma pusillum]